MAKHKVFKPGKPIGLRKIHPAPLINKPDPNKK